MPLFKTTGGKATKLQKQDFLNEKDLQQFVEKNLDELFGIRFLASEYVTSATHGGRIDTLGLDENNAPVIIEYKWGENSAIINQGLFYLDWLMDHPGDFQILVQQKLGTDIEVDHGSPRLVLVAASFTKYDSYAINRMSENIELWTFARYEDGIFELKSFASSQAGGSADNAKQVTKGKYQAYSVESLIKGKSEVVQDLMEELRERIKALDIEGKIEENPKKNYISYRTNRVFVYVNLRVSTIYLDVRLGIEEIKSVDPAYLRDISRVGTHSSGTTRFELSSFDHLDDAMKFIKESYEKLN